MQGQHIEARLDQVCKVLQAEPLQIYGLAPRTILQGTGLTVRGTVHIGPCHLHAIEVGHKAVVVPYMQGQGVQGFGLLNHKGKA